VTFSGKQSRADRISIRNELGCGSRRGRWDVPTSLAEDCVEKNCAFREHLGKNPVFLTEKGKEALS